MLLPVHYSLLSSTGIGAKPPGGCDRGWRRRRVGGVQAYVGAHGRRLLVAVAAAARQAGAAAGGGCGANRQRLVAVRGGGGDGKEKAVCRTTPLALMMVVAGDIFGKACHHVAPSSEK